VRRVGWIAALAALVASSATLVVAVVAVDGQARAQAERDALERARAVFHDIDDETEFTDVADEIDEHSNGGVSIAVYLRKQRAVGAASLPDRPLVREGCRFLMLDATTDAKEWMLCGASDPIGSRIVIAGEPSERLVAHRRALMTGGLLALVVVALGAVFAGTIVVRWSLRPLAMLRETLELSDVSGLASPLSRAAVSAGVKPSTLTSSSASRYVVGNAMSALLSRRRVSSASASSSGETSTRCGRLGQSERSRSRFQSSKARRPSSMNTFLAMVKSSGRRLVSGSSVLALRARRRKVS